MGIPFVRTDPMTVTRFSALMAGLLLAAPSALPQGQEAGSAPREVMWKAPSRADWDKPCLIEWQRTFDDALAVAEDTGKPILICVNMDGEIASEHYAGIRYRTEETAKLYEPYVTVIASTYRHTPRDYTPDGQRIPCPRFGGVTCGEHIAIEPLLFEKYMEGQRVAPRHIMIELDQKEVFDVFYAFDTKSVFDQIKAGIAERTLQPRETERGDRTWQERITSRDQADRLFIERMFQTADEATRVAMLEKAVAAGEAQSAELMRLALLAKSEAQAVPVSVGATQMTSRQLAWKTMVEDPTMQRLPLMETALGLDLDGVDRESLVSALEELGKQSPRAKSLASVQRGLLATSDSLQVDERVQEAQNINLSAVLEENQVIKDALEARARVWQESGQAGDGSAHLKAAEAFLARALDADRRAKETQYLFADAKSLAEEALAMGQSSWLAHGILALCEFRYGTVAASQAHAEKAVQTMPVHAMGRVAVETLRLYALGKRRAIRDAVRSGQDWSPEMLAEAQAAYRVLEHHPLCWEQDCVTQIDFLNRLGAYAQGGEVLTRALQRFPDSAELHLRLRNRILATAGATGLGGLEDTYAQMLADPDATPNLTWFAGYASQLAAEYHRRAGEREQAVSAYERAIDHFEANLLAIPTNATTADHFIAIAKAGKARMAMENGELAEAYALIQDAFQRAPGSMATVDGMGVTGVMTATTLMARLRENEREDLASELQTTLEALSPELRRPPAFDRVGPGRRR